MAAHAIYPILVQPPQVILRADRSVNRSQFLQELGLLPSLVGIRLGLDNLFLRLGTTLRPWKKQRSQRHLEGHRPRRFNRPRQLHFRPLASILNLPHSLTPSTAKASPFSSTQKA
jgi:hypothetical protein